MKIWRLKKGADIRLRQGHPWVFSGELSHSPKETLPGELVEMRDATDRFVAYGMGHPSSTIAFRRLSGLSKESDLLTTDFFLRRLRKAAEVRRLAGWSEVSHRWVFSEADALPGLIIDWFVSGEKVLVSFQISTAGMERARTAFLSALDEYMKDHAVWAVVEASTSKNRKSEGLLVKERQIVKALRWPTLEKDLVRFPLELHHLDGKIELCADFLGGQKTGFFLDQQWNSQILLRLLRPHWESSPSSLRVLDLCSYVGQWSAQVAALAKTLGRPLHLDMVDASLDALALAKVNAEAFGATVSVFEQDVLGEWDAALSENSYDVVICDPPGFVKKKADLGSGLSAYTKLNREAFRRVKEGGLIVTCSCSGAVRDEDFDQALNAAKTKAGRMVRWLARGGHGPDHPIRLEFPEGRYLKCWIGQVEFWF